MLTIDEIRDIVKSIFEENGIDVEDKEMINSMDSLEYISILVSLEEKFDIEFPDSFMEQNMFENMIDVYVLISWLLEEKYEKKYTQVCVDSE